MPGQTWRDNGHKALCPLSEDEVQRRMDPVRREVERQSQATEAQLLTLIKSTAKKGESTAAARPDCLFVSFYGLVLAARRLGGGGRGGKGSCGGRLFEATEIATMDDKMLIKEEFFGECPDTKLI
eukprot:COSAG02_NODE_124_length_35047_cov_31.554179_7_plen_125_part_00